MERKFKVGDIAFKISSTDTGGALIERHEIESIGIREDLVPVIEEGVSVSKEVQTPIIETNITGKNVFESEYNYFKQDDIANELHTYLNRKKLW